jgi:hypothetical protein
MVNDMLIPENNFLPLYNNFLRGLQAVEMPHDIFRRPDLNPDSCWEHLEVKSKS